MSSRFFGSSDLFSPTRYRGAALCIAVAALLQGCGGGADTVQTAAAEPLAPPASGGSNTPPTSTNHAPIISGTPSLAVQAGQAYSFVPGAADSDNDTLTFSITNLPAWASFDKTTGKLSGTPTAAQVGTFANVTITVSDGKATDTLDAFTITVSAAPVVTGSATVFWTPPLTRTDGSALTNPQGFNIRYGKTLGNYTQSVNISGTNVTSWQIDNLNAGTYYFVVTAIDSSGNESEYSAAVSKKIG